MSSKSTQSRALIPLFVGVRLLNLYRACNRIRGIEGVPYRAHTNRDHVTTLRPLRAKCHRHFCSLCLQETLVFLGVVLG